MNEKAYTNKNIERECEGSIDLSQCQSFDGVALRLRLKISYHYTRQFYKIYLVLNNTTFVLNVVTN